MIKFFKDLRSEIDQKDMNNIFSKLHKIIVYILSVIITMYLVDWMISNNIWPFNAQ